jgi:hypothetical protein
MTETLCAPAGVFFSSGASFEDKTDIQSNSPANNLHLMKKPPTTKEHSLVDLHTAYHSVFAAKSFGFAKYRFLLHQMLRQIGTRRADRCANLAQFD